MPKKKQKMHAKSVFSLLFGKLSIVILLMLVQLAILLAAVILLGDHFVAVYGILTALSVTIAVWLVSKDENPAYKLAWIIPILIFPIFGGLFYLMFGNKSMPKKLARRITLAEKSAPRGSRPGHPLRLHPAHHRVPPLEKHPVGIPAHR